MERTGGNSWSKGQAPPPPPGTPPIKHPKKKKEKSVISGVAIAGIIFGLLAIIIIIVALCKRKSSKPSSQFTDEERRSHHRSRTPLASQELSTDPGASVNKEFKGGVFLFTDFAILSVIHDFLWFLFLVSAKVFFFLYVQIFLE